MTKEEAIEIIERYKISDPASLYDIDTNKACDMAIRALEEVDRLKAEQPKKGHWTKPGYADDRWIRCSECGRITRRVDHNGIKLINNFCRMCGADMRGEQDG